MNEFNRGAFQVYEVYGWTMALIVLESVHCIRADEVDKCLS